MLTMTHDLASLLALPAAERWRAYQEGEHLDDATLQAIWDSLRAEGFELPLSDDEARELDAAVREVLAHPEDLVSWDDILREWRAHGPA
jgi:hypothetical protein